MEWMRRALELAAFGSGKTFPNPAVGAVVVRNGEIVGEGWHQGAGLPHAEVVALDAAGPAAQGADIYVTLEPCCHYGRTPPCTEAIIRAGIRRVIYALKDPDPRVAGKGILRLHEMGIACQWDSQAFGKALWLNRAFVRRISLGLPTFELKAAASLDGKTATASGESKWITSVQARQRGHELRSEVQGIIVGIGTLLADDPALTSRIPSGRNPRRFVLDTQARTPVNCLCLRGPASPLGPTTILVGESAPQERIRGLREAGAEVWVLPLSDGRVDLRALPPLLKEAGIWHLLVEGGGTVHGAFLEAGLAGAIDFFLAPKLIGGDGARGIWAGVGTSSLETAPGVQVVHQEWVGPDLFIQGLIGGEWPSLPVL